MFQKRFYHFWWQKHETISHAMLAHQQLALNRQIWRFAIANVCFINTLTNWLLEFSTFSFRIAKFAVRVDYAEPVISFICSGIGQAANIKSKRWQKILNFVTKEDAAFKFNGSSKNRLKIPTFVPYLKSLSEDYRFWIAFEEEKK